MEVNLKREAIQYCTPVYSDTLSREETLETVVSDTLPDVARILDVDAAVYLRSKTLLQGSIRIEGSIRGTVLFVLIELTIGGFNVFTSIKMITGGKPAHQTDTLLTWMYYKAFSTGKFGYAAALSFVMALTLGLLAIVQFRAMKSRDE